jgi:hypothetical protein
MTKKRMALIAVLPLTVAVIVGVLGLLPPRPGVTKANFDRIEKGMTKAEVEKIFGRQGDEDLLPIGSLEWLAEDRSLAIIAFKNDRVDEKRWQEDLFKEPTTSIITDALAFWFR